MTSGKDEKKEDDLMYAVIELNKNQYIVKKGDEISVDKLDFDQKKKEINIENVLFARDKDNILVGKPSLDNVKVNADIVKDYRDKKVVVFKYKKRKGYKKKQGHRQTYTLIKIKDISIGKAKDAPAK